MHITAQIHSQKQKDSIEERVPLTKAPPGLYPWCDVHWLVLETEDAGVRGRAYMYIGGGNKVYLYNHPIYDVDINKRMPSGSITLTYD